MGCFTVLKSKKKKYELPNCSKPTNFPEILPTTLPEPQNQNQSRSLQSAPPSFRTRTAKPILQITQTTNSGIRALSAPSSLHVAQGDVLSSVEYDEVEMRTLHGNCDGEKEQEVKREKCIGERDMQTLYGNFDGEKELLGSEGLLEKWKCEH